MKIKRNKGNGINFADVEIGIAFEDCDGNVYIKIADHELLNKDQVNAIDVETCFLCYIELKEIVYPYKKAYITLEN